MNTNTSLSRLLLIAAAVGALSGLTACDKLRSPKPKAAPAPAASAALIKGAELPAVTEGGFTLPAEGSERLAPPPASAGTPAPELSGSALEQVRRSVAQERASQLAAKPHVDLPVPKGPHKGVTGSSPSP